MDRKCGAVENTEPHSWAQPSRDYSVGAEGRARFVCLPLDLVGVQEASIKSRAAQVSIYSPPVLNF